MKKILIILLLIISFIVPLKADAAYNYSPIGDVIASAEAMILNSIVDSSNLKDANGDEVELVFGDLVDVFGFEDRVFLVDNSAGSVYVLNEKYEYLETFGNVDGPGKLNKPRGIFVTDEFIYLADTSNFRVAIYDHNYQFVREITTPDDPTFKQSPEDENGYNFMPIKIAVDRTGRVYVIADQIFEGIVDFNPDGSFSRYVGANRVELSAWEAFWLMFTTEEQRKAQGYRLATTFINLNVDADGYLYTVSSSSEGEKVIKKLNYKGKDVLNRNGYVAPTGDVFIYNGVDGVPEGRSEFIDITINEEIRIYSVLDRTRGRIFTYDFEGYLLYVGGQINIDGDSGNQKSLFKSPLALTYYKNQILVIDGINKNLVVLDYTDFGNLVNEATKLGHIGKHSEAKAIWEEVLALNTNYFLAYAGIGKSLLREGNYEEAMENLRLGYDDYNYSKAYKQYRYNQMSIYMPYILGISMTLIVFLLVRSVRKSVKSEMEEEKHA
ncbi:MAG: 6-bladed beta-propeller [Bacilli bacterium]|nr:6-bladed beta-propeller [Bacilli bacterium]